MCHWKISQIFFQQECLKADGKPLKIDFPLNIFHVKIKNLKREQAYDSENKIMGDKLLLNSCAKFQRWIHMWNYGKIAKTMLRRLRTRWRQGLKIARMKMSEHLKTIRST